MKQGTFVDRGAHVQKAHVPTYFLVTVYDADITTVARFKECIYGILNYNVGKVKPQNDPK